MDYSNFYLIALCRVPMVGPILGRTLISYCGSAEAVFKTPVKRLAKIPQIGPLIAGYIHNPDALFQAEEEIIRNDKEGIRAIGYLDAAYPGRLKHFEESPLVLFMRGEPDLQPQRTVGIVGTRKPTPLGRAATEEIVEALKPYGVTIISGLAHGIDSAAHHAAIQHKVPTIGILGHGFHTLYPAANRSLARQMASEGNAVMTEFTWDTKPDKENFPMRNRVIAAFSDALLVVESKEKGGSMITAEFANRFNKDVFAMPGRVNDPYSRGCNMLIKRHKAHLLETATDLVEMMRWDPLDKHRSRVSQSSLFVELDPTEQSMVDLLKDQTEMQIDELGFRLAMPPSLVSALLISMEFKGLVHQLPGKRFSLVAMR
jgi:DNA processing protein